MKKIYSYICGLSMLALWACDDVTLNTAPPQYNEQPPVLDGASISTQVSGPLAAAEGEVFDLNDFVEDPEALIPVLTLTQGEGIPEGATLSVEMELGVDEEFSGKTYNVYPYMPVNEDGIEEGEDDEVSTQSKSDDSEMSDIFTYYVTAEDLNSAHYYLFGRDASTIQTVYYRTVVYINLDGTSYRFNNDGNPYTATGSYQETCFVSNLVIEDAYYILGTINGWGVTTAVKLNHDGEDPYENPVFYLNVEITEEQIADNDGWWWKIIPESTYASGNWSDADDSQFGPSENGDANLFGNLVGKLNGQDPGAGAIMEAGNYIFVINMEELVYCFAPVTNYLWTPGDMNGWNQGSSMLLSVANEDGTEFQGYAYLTTGGFKFTSQEDWDGINYGSSGTPGLLSDDGEAGNITVDNDALYWCEVNTATLEYSLTEITTMGVIGDFNGWSTSVALTPSNDYTVWSGTVNLTEGDGFKFRANDDWEINLGGNSPLNLTQDSESNLIAPQTGTYNITLYLGTLPYYCRLQVL